jgi:hypothetical protein
MPRNVPLERILAVRQRQEHRVLAEEALSARRVLFEDTPFLRHTRHREAERQLNMAIASREAAFSDPACLSPRTNGFASPRPSPRQRALMTARLLPMLPTAANQAGGAGLDKVQNGRVPAERLRLHEMLRIVLAKAALAAEASGFQMSGPDSSTILTDAASDAIKAANTHVVARERPEVSLPPGPAEQGAVRRAERKARQSAADMRALRKSCELRRDEPRVQLVTALLGWNPELVFSSEQTSMCLRWLAWLESSQRTPQQLSPRASKPLQHEEPPVQCMKMEYVVSRRTAACAHTHIAAKPPMRSSLRARALEAAPPAYSEYMQQA